MAKAPFMSMRWLRMHIKEIIWTTVSLFVLSCFLIGYGTSRMNARIREENRKAEADLDRAEAAENQIPEAIRTAWDRPVAEVRLPGFTPQSRTISVRQMWNALSSIDEYKRLLTMPPQIRQAFGAHFRDNVLQTLITKALVELYATGTRILPEAQATAIVAQEQARFQPGEFERQLARKGWDLPTYTEMRAEQLLMRAVYEKVTAPVPEAQVNDEAIAKFYQERKPQFKLRDEISFGHLLITNADFRQVASISDAQVEEEYQTALGSYTTGPRAEIRHLFVPSILPRHLTSTTVSAEDIQAHYAANLKNYQEKEQARARHILVKPVDEISRELDTCSLELTGFHLLDGAAKGKSANLLTGSLPDGRWLYLFDLHATAKKPSFKLGLTDIKVVDANGHAFSPDEASLALVKRPITFPIVGKTRQPGRETCAILVPASFTPKLLEVTDGTGKVSIEVAAMHDEEAAMAAAGETARRYYEQALGGEDFAKLASEHSDDPGSKAKGGDLGWFGRGQMVKPFEEAVFGARTDPAVNAGGKLLEPVKSAFGWHVIRVEGYKPAATRKLEDVRAEISRQLREELARIRTENDVETWREQAATRRSTKFSDLIASHSVAPSRDNGGKLPPFFQGEMQADDFSPAEWQALSEIASDGRVIEAIEEVVFKMKEAEISPVIRTDHGFHVIELVSWQKPKRLKLGNTLKERIRDHLIDQRAEQLAKAQAEELKARLTAANFNQEAKAVKGEDYDPDVASLPFALTGDLSDFSFSQHIGQLSEDGKSMIPALHAALTAAVRAVPGIGSASGIVPLEARVLGPIQSRFGWHLVLPRTAQVNRYRPLDEVKNEIRQHLTQAPSEAEIKQHFEENREKLDQPERRRCRQITVTTEQEAKDLHQRLLKGELFSILARQYSIEGSAANQGDIGEIEKGKLPAHVDEKIFSMTAGQFSEPLRMPFGYALFLVESITPGKKAELDANTRTQVTNSLKEKLKQDAFEGFIKFLLNQASITRHHEMLELL